ncbi:MULTISPECIES: DUF5789 family protein [Salinirubellus]|uniref:DUF5789 family protein n=1 Tax=Salinirubellus TaxID=2162630 RepID=UPI003621B008
MTVTTDQNDDSREQGVEFGSLAEELEEEAYPIGKEELLDTYGDEEIVLEDDTQTLREVLEPLGEDEFESADDVRQSVMTMVGDEAVGRKNYSDRGGETDSPESDEESV